MHFQVDGQSHRKDSVSTEAQVCVGREDKWAKTGTWVSHRWTLGKEKESAKVAGRLREREGIVNCQAPPGMLRADRKAGAQRSTSHRPVHAPITAQEP